MPESNLFPRHCSIRDRDSDRRPTQAPAVTILLRNIGHHHLFQALGFQSLICEDSDGLIPTTHDISLLLSIALSHAMMAVSPTLCDTMTSKGWRQRHMDKNLWFMNARTLTRSCQSFRWDQECRKLSIHTSHPVHGHGPGHVILILATHPVPWRAPCGPNYGRQI